MVSASISGRAASWINTKPGAGSSAASRSSPSRTNSCRVAPPATGSGKAEARHRRVVKLPMSGLDHHLNGTDGIMAKKRAYRMVQHGTATQILVLFGAVTAEAFSAAGGDDQRHT